MAKSIRQYAEIFDAQTLRERALIALSALSVVAFLWWVYFAEPALQAAETLQQENRRVSAEVANTRKLIGDIRQRIKTGVHLEKEGQLARLIQDLAELDDRLRVTTIELVDPENMFRLMNQLIYRESKLELQSLKRREVKPAIPSEDPADEGEEPSIYRHVLEIEFAGRYLDILNYMQTLEALDWKLLWDEIEISSGEYPQMTVKLVISTLSTRKEWVGI